VASVVAFFAPRPETASSPGCPTCGCVLHAALRTYAVVCVVCHRPRWLYTTTPPEQYVCRRCLARSTPRRRVRLVRSIDHLSHANEGPR
jgi:hypothetical protein